MKNNYRTKYNYPDYRIINCNNFGKCDGMNGCCVECLYDSPYQWEMCSDEAWKRGLMSPYSKIPNCTEDKAINFINEYKTKYYK